jgi:hypothetical protein
MDDLIAAGGSIRSLIRRIMRYTCQNPNCAAVQTYAGNCCGMPMRP